MEEEIKDHTDAIGHGEVDALTDPPAYDNEHSFCNCENNECITPYESEQSIGDGIAAEDEHREKEADTTQGKQTTGVTALPTIRPRQRLKNDLAAAGKNPYIQREHTCRIHLYRKKGDTEPIDSFEANTTHGFSARAMLLLGAALLGFWALTRMMGKEK